MRAVATIVLVALTIALAPSQSARAADGLQVSSDGTHWGTALTTEIFSDIGGLVPAESRSGHFWVLNETTGIAYLRLTLADARASDSTYASALSVVAAVDGVPGPAVNLAATGTCASLITATKVHPGEVMRVDAVLTLADLPGSTAQNADAQFAMNASLSDLPPRGDRSADCAIAGVSIPITAPVDIPPDTGTAPTTGSTAVPTPGSTATPTPRATTAPTPAPTPVPTITIAAAPPFRVSNGAFPGWGSLWPIVGLALGGIAFIIVAWRRRRRDDQQDEEATA